ncbi:MAG: LacI family DNA-binding transcriptional regulator [Lautropia sp.]|nr:LacI family DNA-binding transcriptional regulator [Lautropia sp.]
MKKKAATSHDVARLAGVARSTVSHVLNGSNAVRLSDETRRKVREAARTLGYRPNSAALMLRHGATRTVGLLVTRSSSLSVDGYVPPLFMGIGSVLRRQGYHVLLETFDTENGDERYGDLVETRRIDGLIVLGPDPDSAELRAIVESDFPIVLIGSIGSPKEVSVSGEIDAALDEAVDHLVALGHRAIGCIPFSPMGFVASDRRTGKLLRALKKRQLCMPEEAIECADFSAESGHQAMRTLLTRRPDLTAVFAGNDTIALGAIGGAAALGYGVPRDLSIIGFDDLAFAAHMHPALSTIRQDAIQQGRQAARLLVARVNGMLGRAEQRISTARFVARASTARVRLEGPGLG